MELKWALATANQIAITHFFIKSSEKLQIKKSYILIIIIIHNRQTLTPASKRFINPRKSNIDPECKAEGSMIPWDNKSFR